MGPVSGYGILLTQVAVRAVLNSVVHTVSRYSFRMLRGHSGDINCFGFLFWMCLFWQVGAFHAGALKHLKEATGCDEMPFEWGKPI